MPIINDYLKRKYPEQVKYNKSDVEIAGFAKLIRVTETIKSTSTVATAQLENGATVADHVLFEPTIITITGNVADIHVAGDASSDVISSVREKIANVDQFIPSRTATQISKISGIVTDILNTEALIESAVRRNSEILSDIGVSDSLLDKLTLAGAGKNQIEFLNTMEAVKQEQATNSSAPPLSLNVGGRTYENMIITDLEVNFDNVEVALEFSMQFTQVYFADTRIEEFEGVAKNPDEGSKDSVSKEEEKGSQVSEEVPEEQAPSWLVQFLNKASSAKIGG